MAIKATRSLGGDLAQNLHYFVVSTGQTVTADGLVSINVLGFVVPATSGDKLLGTVLSTTTGDGTAEVGVQIDPAVVYLADANANLQQDDVGKYFDLADSLTIDETPALTTTGQMVCLEVNPFGDGLDTGLFAIAESTLTPYIQDQ